MKSICVLLLVAGVCRGSVIPLKAQAQLRIQEELGQYAGGHNPRVTREDGPMTNVQNLVGPSYGGVAFYAGSNEGAVPDEYHGSQVSYPGDSPAEASSPEAQEPDEAASDENVVVVAAPAPAPAPVNPFLPVQHTPEVDAAKAQHLGAVQEAEARDAETGTEASEEPTETPETPEPAEEPSSTPETPAPEPESSPASAPEPAPAPTPAEPVPIPSALSTVGVAAPLPSGPIVLEPPVAAPSVFPVGAPLAAVGVAPIVPIDADQYRVQDELGQFSFGYIGGPNAREEISTADGITRGGYTYVDGNGLIQSASYISDPVNGFRVAATNIPLQPAPAYIPDSPEVAEAKEALFRAQAEHIAKL